MADKIKIELPIEDKIELAKKQITKYSPRHTIERMRNYLRECIDKRKTPFSEEFALKLGVSERTIRNWANDEDKPEFSEWYEILKTIQKLDLKRKSLSGVYISRIGNLLLSADHGIVETVKREIGGMDGNPIEVTQTLSPEDRKAYSDQITKMFEKIYSKPNGKRPN